MSIEQLPPEPGPSTQWMGANMLKGGKAYVSAPLGQLHYRDMGPQQDTKPPLLLLHQTPQCMAEFGAIQNVLAVRGIRSIAIDTPGHGMSDQPEIFPTIGGFADNMIALLDHLALKQVFVGGHHTGASIATALAARHPARVAGVVLHGCALYTAEEAQRLRGKPEFNRSPVLDGSHLSQFFKWKGAGDADDLYNRTWMSAAMFLQGPDIGHWAVNRYDMAADLTRVQAPGLIISELEDVTYHMDQRARTLRPDFSYRVIAERGMSAIMSRPANWSDLAAAFITEVL